MARRQKKNIFRWIMLIFLNLTLLIVAGCDDGGEDNSAMTPRMVADVNKPGVVLITNVYSAQISVPDFMISQVQSQKLLQQLLQQMQQGRFKNQQEVFESYVEEILKNPSLYLVSSAHVINQDVKAGCMGSGFIVTEDGYIVTNAHVVASSEEQLKEILVEDGLQQIIKKNMQGFQTELSRNGYTLSVANSDKLQRVIVQFYAKHVEVHNVKQQIYANLGMRKLEQGFPCQIKKQGKAAPGKDIAILKAEKTKLPTVQLGNDSESNAGDKIFVLGYPGAATFNQILAQDAKLESTFTAGMVSARKSMPDKWDVLQVDAAITHGNSGGPVFDDKGKVIGVVTFGSADEQGSMVQGMNFAIPVSIVKEFLQEIDVVPEKSELRQRYQIAVTDFSEGEYETALNDFSELHNESTEYPYVQEFMEQAQKAINKEK